MTTEPIPEKTAQPRVRGFRRRFGFRKPDLGLSPYHQLPEVKWNGEGAASPEEVHVPQPEPLLGVLEHDGFVDQGAREEHIEDHYLSPDSAPQGYAMTRPLWVAPAVLALFVAVCAALVPALPKLTAWYASLLATITNARPQDLLGQTPSLCFRPFFPILIVLLGLFALGPRLPRVRLVVYSLGHYAAGLLALDVLLAASGGILPSPFSAIGGILAAVVGLLAILVTIFTRYNLPPGVKVVRREPRVPGTIGQLALCVALALAAVAALSIVRSLYLPGLEIPFLGGLDSKLVLFLLALWIALYVASVRRRRRRPKSGPLLSVAFLVPAYNEGHEITRTIEALDWAAARYGGRVALYVVDNGSKDGTQETAARSLLECGSLTGEVLECPLPGKGRALNFGLARVGEDIVIRIDADTLVPPDLLVKTIPWFWDPTVGGVAGLPMPREDTPRWLYPLRIIEVIYGVAFLRFAQTAANATMVMPGFFSSFRRAGLQELGGFGEGFNGEDADATMRVGRLGYRIVTDTSIRVRTEVPTTLMHLREQRQRWARGLFHMASRNMSAIWLRQGARGLWLLPWSLFNGIRRSMMIPVLACALTVELLDPSALSLREVSVIAGFVVGLQMIVTAALLAAHRHYRAIPFVPTYLLFRMLRAYVAFETILSLDPKRSVRPDRGERVWVKSRTGIGRRATTWVVGTRGRRITRVRVRELLVRSRMRQAIVTLSVLAGLIGFALLLTPQAAADTGGATASVPVTASTPLGPPAPANGPASATVVTPTHASATILDRPVIAPARSELRWVLTGSNMRKLAKLDSSLSSYFFDSQLAFGTGNRLAQQDQVPDSYAAVPTGRYASYADFLQDLITRRIDPTIRAVSYDPEHWDETPLNEQRDPFTYMRIFSGVAHDFGYIAITTPARDLMGVRGGGCVAGRGESYSEAFVRCNVAGEAARWADITEVQAQRRQTDLASYEWLIRSTAAQARAANPSIAFLSGLSTRLKPVSAQQLFEASSAVADAVDGFYLSIAGASSNELETAIDYLALMRAAGY